MNAARLLRGLEGRYNLATMLPHLCSQRKGLCRKEGGELELWEINFRPGGEPKRVLACWFRHVGTQPNGNKRYVLERVVAIDGVGVDSKSVFEARESVAESVIPIQERSE